MAFQSIMVPDVPNVKPKYPASAPSNNLSSYRLGIIPSGAALRRMVHYHISDKVAALYQFEQWQALNTFLEGKVYVDANQTTAIATAFFLDVLPAQAHCWEGQTYEEVGLYPYLDPSSVLLAEENSYDDFDDLTTPPYLESDVSRQVTGLYQQPWQLTDITTDPFHLEKLVKEADQAQTTNSPTRPSPRSTCEQRFTDKQLITLAQALYRVPYTIRRYTKRGAWDSYVTVYYLEPTSLPPVGKRFALSTFDYEPPMPWYRPPCTFLTVSTSYGFADPLEHRTMTTLWNAAHTPTKKLPKLLQRGFSRRSK